MQQNYPVIDAGQNYPYQGSEQQHSRFGIACFILSIVSGIFVFVPFIIEALTQPVESEGTGYLIIMLASLCVNFIGIGLGIAGLFEKNRKKVFAILGLCFSAATIMGLVCLFIIGSVYNSVG